MEVAIRKMGNSQSVLIPKPILAQLGLEGRANLQVLDGVIEIRAVRRNPREGWADDARRLAGLGDDDLGWIKPDRPRRLDGGCGLHAMCAAKAFAIALRRFEHAAGQPRIRPAGASAMSLALHFLFARYDPSCPPTLPASTIAALLHRRSGASSPTA